jgi:hypothetical protein
MISEMKARGFVFFDLAKEDAEGIAKDLLSEESGPYQIEFYPFDTETGRMNVEAGSSFSLHLDDSVGAHDFANRLLKLAKADNRHETITLGFGPPMDESIRKVMTLGPDSDGDVEDVLWLHF